MALDPKAERLAAEKIAEVRQDGEETVIKIGNTEIPVTEDSTMVEVAKEIMDAGGVPADSDD